MKKYIVHFFLFVILMSQEDDSFKKIGGYYWPVSINHVIIQTDSSANEETINEWLKKVNSAKYVSKLNEHNFHLIKFRNFSKTPYIYRKQIDILKGIGTVIDIIPVAKYKDGTTTIDTYKNSFVKGFGKSRNDSLFLVMRKLRSNLYICSSTILRLQKKIFEKISISFNLKVGRVEDVHLVTSIKEDKYLSCFKRVLLSPFRIVGENDKKAGEIKMLYVID